MNNLILREALRYDQTSKIVSDQFQKEFENKHRRNVMKRFEIKRDIPLIGQANAAALQGASAQSRSAIEGLQKQGKQIEWEQSNE